MRCCRGCRSSENHVNPNLNIPNRRHHHHLWWVHTRDLMGNRSILESRCRRRHLSHCHCNLCALTVSTNKSSLSASNIIWYSANQSQALSHNTELPQIPISLPVKLAVSSALDMIHQPPPHTQHQQEPVSLVHMVTTLPLVHAGMQNTLTPTAVIK